MLAHCWIFSYGNCRGKIMSSWETIETAWYDTSVQTCALCGQMIPKRFWEAEVRGEALVFCSEECEQLYRSYWLPKYGPKENGR